MAKQRTFGNVTQAIWNCVKTTSKSQHGTKYEPADANQGTATTQSIVGDVVLSFDFDPSKDSVTYVILKKPFLASDDQIWNGIHETIEDCQSS